MHTTDAPLDSDSAQAGRTIRRVDAKTGGIVATEFSAGKEWPSEAGIPSVGRLTVREMAWMARQQKKMVRVAMGTSRYVVHQGKRERARRLARMGR